ncbi:MAG: hypothetical protein Q9161_008382 [Pseudevernia consocians]
MSQQLVLDISSATARSKGQARRRNQPALSEDARKAQRNFARRERARCKKTEKTEERLLSSAQASPYADQPQYGSQSPIKGKAAHKFAGTPLLPHLPTFTVLPAHADDINIRALAQSSRYIAAQSKAQKTKDIVRGDVQQNGDVFGDISVRQPQHGSKSPITPEEQDWDAAETLIEVAKGQRTVSTAMDTEAISVDTGGDSDADASIEDSWRCRFATCEYYHRPFLLKMERDEHTRKHAKGNIKCGLWSCRFASAAKPENPKFYFENLIPFPSSSPLYIYPDSSASTWKPSFNAITAHPQVNWLVVVNPDSGPGTNASYPSDLDIITGISHLSTAFPTSSHSVGYVDTAFTHRALAAVTNDIDVYASCSTYTAANISINGIFFDDVKNTAFTSVYGYMQSASSYAYETIPSATTTTTKVVFNPGAIPPRPLFGYCDFIVEFEDPYSNYREATTIRSIPSGTRSRSAILAYNFPTAANVANLVHPMKYDGVGAVYFTADLTAATTW